MTHLPGEAAAGSAFSDLLRSRRSIRDFLPEPIPASLLEAVLADASWAPSWSNTQPYLIAVADGQARDRLAARLTDLFDRGRAAQRGSRWDRARLWLTRDGLPDGDFDTRIAYPEVLQQRRRATGFGLYSVLGIQRADHAARDRQMRRNFEFFGAPTVVFVFVHTKLREFAVLDAGAFVQTLMLAAHARGLGSCAQGALATWAGPVRAEFDVPGDYALICAVALGYASDHPVNAYNPGRAPVDRAFGRARPGPAPGAPDSRA